MHILITTEINGVEKAVCGDFGTGYMYLVDLAETRDNKNAGWRYNKLTGITDSNNQYEFYLHNPSSTDYYYLHRTNDSEGNVGIETPGVFGVNGDDWSLYSTDGINKWDATFLDEDNFTLFRSENNAFRWMSTRSSPNSACTILEDLEDPIGSTITYFRIRTYDESIYGVIEETSSTTLNSAPNRSKMDDSEITFTFTRIGPDKVFITRSRNKVEDLKLYGEEIQKTGEWSNYKMKNMDNPESEDIIVSARKLKQYVVLKYQDMFYLISKRRLASFRNLGKIICRFYQIAQGKC